MCFTQFIVFEITFPKWPYAQSTCRSPVAKEPPDWAPALLEPFVDMVHKAIASGLYIPDPSIPVQVKPDKETFDRLRSELNLD